ncbi:MAG: phosphoribosylaminoimidazolesuccinocarboxamide synthase [Armatimonadetes bacterium]|nr:phosphoribosylaminoimidazolesuccinocarboxamide synthase [Armatimonadota bacterium]
MLTLEELMRIEPLTGVAVPQLGTPESGKVRDIFRLGERRLMVTTDRISAFDRIIGAVPCKGQVLNQLTAWWMNQTRDVVANHLLDLPHPNVIVAIEAEPLPVEVIVRGYITGVTPTSLWTMYLKGDRKPYGVRLPDGLRKNDALPHPIITPTTKAAKGGRDQQLTCEQVVREGLVEENLWNQVQEAALALFARGQERARSAGLILADTKYEFGLDKGRLMLIDELHTADSSRFWQDEPRPGEEPRNLDKEVLRLWLASTGFQGEGAPPELPGDRAAAIAMVYIELYERLTGEVFHPAASPVAEHVARCLEHQADLVGRNSP